MTSYKAVLPGYRRNKHVYGKGGRLSRYDTSNLGACLDEESDSAKRKSEIPKHTNIQAVVNEALPLSKPQTNRHSLKPLKRTAKYSADPFDVPSSGDEIIAPNKRHSPLRLRSKKSLVDDSTKSNAPLASWEKKGQERAAIQGRYQKHENVAESQNRPGAIVGQSNGQRARGQMAAPDSQVQGVSLLQERNVIASYDQATPRALSATERLAARRHKDLEESTASAELLLSSSQPLAKRSAPHDGDQMTHRKRLKTLTSSTGASEDAAIEEKASIRARIPDALAQVEVDVFEFPASIADDTDNNEYAITDRKSPDPPAKRAKIPKLYSRKSRSATDSAPNHHFEVVSTDTDTLDPDTPEPNTRSPSPSVNKVTSLQRPRSLPSSRAASPDTANEDTLSFTPKQSQLWNRLLSNDSSAPSPTTLPMKDLAISGKQLTARLQNVNRTLTKSKSDVPRKRTRLVDRLKASTALSDEDSSSEQEFSGMPERASVKAQENSPEGVPKASPSKPQSKTSQNGGLKITYASQRSYLPEDNFEDDLMLGLTTEASQPSKIDSGYGSKALSNSQQSTFDVESSDEEAETGRLRTIHELRAAGRNIRAVEDIESLMRDIENRSVKGKSRRRGALIELAIKVTDRSFAEHFVSHSFELQLVAECATSPDEIANFVLAAIFAFLSPDLSEHSLAALKTGGVLVWLTNLFDADGDIVRLAKERRNTAKGIQESLTRLADLIKAQSSLWEDQKPLLLTPRLIGLKTAEQLVKRLRGFGDRSDLLDQAHLSNLLPSKSIVSKEMNQLELSIVVSLLELLSSSSVLLDWPSKILTQIPDILLQINPHSPATRHTLFLTLRLCLNLTNDNLRSCNKFATLPVVQFLLNSTKDRFALLDTDVNHENPDRAVSLDLLVLSMGNMINLAEHSAQAREHASHNLDTLSTLTQIFQQGQKNMLNAESVEESISNVAFGYLAVMLANICQNDNARSIIASKLPGQKLDMLISAVGEFVVHHQKVDTMGLAGEEGREVWGVFTDKLKLMLHKLEHAAGAAK